MNSSIVENLGWTLLHSLWQIGFVALVLFMALRVLRDFSANLRYAVSVSALILSLILPVTTFVYLSTTTNPVQTAKQPLPTISKPILTQETKSQIIAETVDVPPIVSADNSVLSPSPKIPYLTILVVFWLIGVTIFAVRLVGGIWTVHLYKTRQVSEVESHWQTKFDKLCESLQIKRKVRFLKSQMVEMPVVIGWLKPVVLVPASAFLQISPKELETILLHELTHIKRHDYLVNFGQSLVEILFFYHPCVWWISAKIRAEREFAVDEFVSQVFETERFVYARALATLEEIRSVPIPTLAMAANGGNLMKRIENILNGSRKINSKNVSIWSAVFAVTFVVGVIAGIYWLQISKVKAKTGKKVAVIFSKLSDKPNDDESYRKFLALQSKYKIPATWVLDSSLIDATKQDQTLPNFFSQTRANNSDFILEVPNISSTIFINGDDEYIKLWKERIRHVEDNLAKNEYQLKKYSIGYSSQIPQEMENFLASRGLKLTKLPRPDFDIRFYFLYEKNCSKSEKGFTCHDPDAEEQKEIKEKYLRYVNEVLELDSRYYKEKFGRDVPQILRLGTSNLTDDSADELLQNLQDKGYEFVPLEEVTSDEAYKSKDTRESYNELSKEKFRILDKYLDRKFPAPPRVDDGKKVFNVDVNTKDFKAIAK